MMEAEQIVRNSDVKIGSEHKETARTVFTVIADNTRRVLEGSKTLTKKLLQKTYYTHNVLMFVAESYLLKSIGTQLDNKKLTFASLLPFVAGSSASLDFLHMRHKGELKLGQHMDVSQGRYRSFSPKQLEDGTILHPGDKIGIIDFKRDLPALKPDDNLVRAVKGLFDSAQVSLEELAALCERNDPRVEGIKTFYGISSLAATPQAKRLGFETNELQNPFTRFLLKEQGKMIIRRRAQDNTEWWKRYKDSFRTPKEAFISREKLVSLYGSDKTSEKISA